MDSFSSREIFKIKSPEILWESDSLFLKVRYECEEFNFEENYKYQFPPFVRNFDEAEIQRAAQLVSLSACTSYYKAMLAKKIECEFELSQELLNFLKGLLGPGLAEFRFHNQLDLESAPDMSLINRKDFVEILGALDSNSAIVPIGGGKDSVTTLEIVKRSGMDVIGFSVGTFESIDNCAKTAGVDLVHVDRMIDPKLIELNNAGFPNGHVPVTALTSALAVLCAAVLNAGNVTMSNESSANEATRIINGYEVNHQWSKSIEAENLIRQSLDSFGIRVNYFSALRTLSEFEIFSLFSHFDQYHQVFTSCNRVFKIDKEQRHESWCGNCDKCRFVFLGLSAFLGAEPVAKIFGKNLFEDESQLHGFKDLIGIEDSKPFECVGTVRESRMLIRNCLLFDHIQSSPVGKQLQETIEGLSELEETIPNSQNQHFLSDLIADTILDIQTQQYVSHLTNHLEGKSVGIMGLGRDTSSIVRLLSVQGGLAHFKVLLPNNQGIDQKQFETILVDNALDTFRDQLELISSVDDLDSDIVFVSPGIPKYSDIVNSLGTRATTPLAWWLEYNKTHLRNKCFIGVTGTKGKSTTASLLNHVLPNSIVAGNLGFAVGNISIKDLLSCDYCILEVSSFQASYVKKSPDIVAITALFDCHIDWHRNVHNYRSDKLNLALHGASELIVSDTIADFAPMLAEIRKTQGNNGRTDVITLVPSVGRSLLQRNQEVVRAIVALVAPGMTNEDIDDRFDSFAELKHRQEVISSKNDVMFVSDVLSTAPGAVLTAVDDFILRYPKANIFLLLGGADREVDQSELIHGLNSRKEKVTSICLPETGHMIESHLENSVHCPELVDGVKLAWDKAQAGDIVLLAPGAPSFHRYGNYEELAEHFSKLVESL